MAIGYVRVSTEGQAGDDRFGITAQKEAIQKYAEERGLEITEFIIDTISGVKDERPGFDRLMETETDAVIVYKSDRVARDMKLYFYYLYLFEKRGVKLLSVNEEFDEDNGLANIYRAILQFVAEQERNNIRMRTMAGRKQKKLRGGYGGGRPPLGYFEVNGRLYVDKQEAKSVRKIFELREENYGYGSIVAIMNREGYVTKERKSFHVNTIVKVLKNRKFYEGYNCVDGEYVKAIHEPIIGENEFNGIE